MKLILVRHGEIDSNVAKVYSGRSREQLNEVGRQQAAEAVKRLGQYEISAIFSSPLPRAVETARIIGSAIHRTVKTSESFNELRMGAWEGLSESEVAARYPSEFAVWNSAPADLRLAGRETLDELRQRVIRGIAAARETVVEGNIVIVSHVAVIRVIQLVASQRSLNEYKRIHVPNATPIIVDWVEDSSSIGK